MLGKNMKKEIKLSKKKLSGLLVAMIMIFSTLVSVSACNCGTKNNNYPDSDNKNNSIEMLCSRPGDFDGDGDIDTADLLYLLGHWGTPYGDVDGDGDTDTADLLYLLGHWGP